MRKVLKWLTGPDVLPLLARLALVALTALLAEPVVEPALPPEAVAGSLGAALEIASRRSSW